MMIKLTDIEHLPEIFTEEPSKRYKFYPDRQSFDNKSGGKIKQMCEEAILTFANIHFREEHNLETIGDLLDLLNSWGYSDGFYHQVQFWGFKFNYTSWSWTCNSWSRETPILSFKDAGAGDQSCMFSTPKKKHLFEFYDKHHSSMLRIFYSTELQQDLGIPDWLIRKNKYNFVPPKYDFKTYNDYSSMFFGVEIEVASKLSPSDLQYVVTKVEPVQEPFFYFKHDGTISPNEGMNNQYEIVTFPCSYRYLRKNFHILFSKLKHLLPDYKDYFYAGPNSGIHIHMSKDGFFSELHRKKFVAVWNQYDRSNTEFIQKIGRRQFTDYCRVHPRHVGLTLARRLNVSAFGQSGELKYASCRETRHTTEVRIFKGGFEYDHILYCLEAVKAMYEYTDKSPLSSISTRRFIPEFTDWLNGQRKFPLLKNEVNQCA